MRIRRRLLARYAALLGALTLSPNAHAQDITTGLRALYALDDTSGSTCVDSSGQGAHGTYVGTPALGSSGRFGTSVNFSGSGGTTDRMNLPHTVLNGVTHVTLSFWIRTTSNVYHSIISGVNNSNDNEYFVFIESGGVLKVRYKNNSNTASWSLNSLHDGKWHHIVIVTNNTTDQTTVYQDSVSLGSQSISLSGTFALSSGGLCLAQDQDCVGGCFDAAQRLIGQLDQIRIYNRVLTVADIQYLYSEDEPILHLKLNETSGTTAADSSGYGRNGTVVGAGGSWIPARRHNGYRFTGSNKIEVNSLLGNPTSFTVACWVKCDATDTSAADAVNIGDYIVLRPHEVDGNAPSITFYRGSNNWYRLSGTTGSYVGRGWHHFAGTFDDATDTIKLYIDGVQVGTATTTHQLNWTGLGTKTVLGAHGNGSTTWDLTGALDDVRVYNKALTQSEIIDLYGLVGRWKLTETSGTVASDSSGKALNGTYTSGPTVGQSGPYPGAGQYAASFDGSNDYVNGPAASNYDFEDGFSISGWVCLDAYTASAALLQNGSTTQNCELSITGTGQVTVAGRSSGGLQSHSSTATLPLGVWKHVVGAYDRSTFRIYIDGVLSSSANNAFTVVATPSGNLTLAASLEGTDQFLDGRLHDVRLYNRALVAEEVAELYGLIGAWALDETSGTTANDSSGMKNNGTYTNSPTLAQSGPYPAAGANAAQFDGTNDHVVAGAVSTDLSAGFSIAAWVRPTNLGSNQRIIDFGNGQDIDNILLSRDGTSADLRLAIKDGSSGNTQLVATGALNPNLWRHYAATCDSAGNGKLYRDGQQIASGSLGTPSAVARKINYIGRSNLAADAYFQGRMQDVRLYNRPLSTQEIAELYGLIGHWKLDEGSGTVVADASGAGAAAAFNAGAPAWISAAPYGNGLVFNGASDVRTTGNFTPPSVGTVAYWMRPNGIPAAMQRLLGISDNWEVRQGTDGIIYLDLCGDATGGFFTVTTPTTANRWYHVLATFNSADDSYATYIDGVLDKGGTSSTNLVAQAAAQLSIGTRTGTTERFVGALDDVRVYNRKMSPWEISQVYGLMAWYKLDETSGTAAADSTARGQDGTYSGSPTLNVTANGAASQGSAVAFNGSNSMQASGLYDKSASVTASAWVRLDGTDSGGAEAISLGDCFVLRLNSGSTGARAGYYNGSTYVWAIANQVILNTGWRHFAAVLRGGDTIKLYIDGVEAASTAASGAISYAGQGSNSRIAAHGNGATTLDLTGRMDDVRIYNRALTALEIFAQYRGSRINGIKVLKWVETR